MSTGTPDLVAGATSVRLYARTVLGVPDEALGTTTITAAPASIGVVIGIPDQVSGATSTVATFIPDLSGNPAVELGLSLTGDFALWPAGDNNDLLDQYGNLEAEYQYFYNDGRSPTLPTLRSPAILRPMPTVVVTLPTPIVSAGKPSLPAYVGNFSASASAKVSPTHIHVQDPAGSHPNGPEPDSPQWHARWSVDDLPDPPTDSFYWLGAPSVADGTAGIGSAYQSWPATGGKGPTWHSFFPYKPSVRGVDHYLPDGGVVHHPKGVHFNSHFIEHMWCDFGGPRPQPFTWAIAAMIVGYPDDNYLHYILDAGRNPDKVGFPRLSASGVNTPRSINDGLGYRTALACGHHGELMATRNDLYSKHTLRVRSSPKLAPRMFFGVYNGSHSRVGAYQPGKHFSHAGAIDNGAAQQHRYYVLGRSQGFISQHKASHLLVFEMRYWRAALTEAQLKANYDQLASTWQFHKYRRV